MKIKLTLIILSVLLFAPLQYGQAQFRTDNESTLNRTGPILRSNDSQNSASFWGLQDFRMDHSYEMSVGSFAGDMYNRNTYTNTMHLLFNENLYGRVDLAMSHSPFGNNFMGQNNQAQFYVRNAELNYKFSENAQIQVRFQQIPAGHFGYGYGYGPGYHPHYHRGYDMHSPFRRW